MSSDVLRKHLNAIEAEKRFNGKAYPEGLEPFPRTLVGQGFFPGGDGLWRDADQSSLREPSRYAFPYCGIMFLGNDFGTLESFQKLQLHENPPTWWRLRQRLELHKFPERLAFIRMPIWDFVVTARLWRTLSNIPTLTLFARSIWHSKYGRKSLG